MNRVFDLVGWHCEFYINYQSLQEMSQMFLKFPKICIDHVGMEKESIPILCQLVENGAFVKATAFMRQDFEVLPVLKQIHQINQNALIFGTDLPGTRASRQASKQDITLIQNNFDENDCLNIFEKNAQKLYFI